MPLDLQHITRQTCKLAVETGGFLRQEIRKLRSSDIELKSFNNFVTYVDRESEAKIIEQLGKILPGSDLLPRKAPALAGLNIPG